MNERPSERKTIPFYASLHGRFLIVLLGLTALPALAIGGLALLNGRESIDMKQHLAQEMNRSARHSHSFALLMIDIDGFKRYNDRFGHPAGDRMLIEFTEVLRKSLRASDTIVRYGGDEFVVILPETGQEGASSAAGKLLEAIRDHSFPHARLSVSIGACICSPPFPVDADASWVISRADQALYQAKREGGNAYSLSE